MCGKFDSKWERSRSRKSVAQTLRLHLTGYWILRFLVS